jgi:hypothetical protein
MKVRRGRGVNAMNRRYSWRLVIIGAAVVAGSLMIWAFGPRVVRRAAPRLPILQLSVNRLDLGNGKPNEIKRGSITIRNVGSVLARFTISASCGCTELEPRSGTLGPDEEQPVRVGIQLPGYSNSEKSSQLTVAADGSRAPLSCLVLAKCPPPLKVSCDYIDFGRVSSRTHAAAAEVAVEAMPDQPALRIGSLSVRHESEHFLVTTNEEESPFVVQIKPGTDLPVGDYFDTLELRMSNSDEALRIPIRLQIVDDISVIPPTVFLRCDPDTGKPRPANLLVTNARPQWPEGDLVIVKGPPGILLENTGGGNSTNNKIRRFRLSFADEWSGGESTVLVGFTKAEDKVAVRLVSPAGLAAVSRE